MENKSGRFKRHAHENKTRKTHIQNNMKTYTKASERERSEIKRVRSYNNIMCKFTKYMKTRTGMAIHCEKNFATKSLPSGVPLCGATLSQIRSRCLTTVFH